MRPAVAVGRWPILTLLFAALGCEVSSEGPRDREAEGTKAMMPASEVDSIARRMRTEFAEWFATGGEPSTMVSSMYAPDAIFSDELGRTHAGRAALGRAFSRMAPGSSIETRSLGAVGSGDLLVDLGTYEVTFPLANGERATANGRYMLAFQRMDDGSWKVVRQLTTGGAAAGNAGTPDTTRAPADTGTAAADTARSTARSTGPRVADR